MTNIYAGISVNAADAVETYAFVPNLLDAIDIPYQPIKYVHKRRMAVDLIRNKKYIKKDVTTKEN